jgi:type III secretory pathway lipoprotein EscJ
MKRAATFVVGLLVAACNVPIAAGLDETDANHAVVALEHGGVASD